MYQSQLILIFLTSVVVAVFATWHIILFARKRDIYDQPNERKLHTKKISNLGGVGVFMASMFAYFAFSDINIYPRPDTLFSITIILFFIGLKDDLEPVKPFKRLAYEVLCAIFIIYFTDISINSLFGIFNIHELPIWASYIITVLFVVACINAYNMIDGIDGLIASLSLLGSTLFGLMFLSAGEYLWAMLCVSISGALIGFLIYNWHPARIFMGNGGSMFLGTFFACACLRFMQLNVISHSFFDGSIRLTILMPHTIALSVIAVPIFDLLSVFVIRLLNKQSPFNADKRHTHHRLLDIGCSHWLATIVIVLANVAIIVFAYFVQDTGALRSLLYTILFCTVLQLLLFGAHWRWFAKKQASSK